MPIETIAWKNGAIRYVDQRLLPHRLVYRECRDVRRLWTAIKRLEIRGAPAIGIAGALGVASAAVASRASTAKGLCKDVGRVARYLASARPTAVNLSWAVARMEHEAKACSSLTVAEMRRRLVGEALEVVKEDKSSCRAMAKYGSRLVRDGDVVLTHCNAGGLATADYGTALGVLFEAKRQGKRIKVFADETRPLLQGARLTAWELMHAGIKTTLICDNMAASVMAKGTVTKIFVGADRIAANGDTANKIGTYGLAVSARYHDVPFYIVAPLSTIDPAVKTGDAIPIEERDPDEVRIIGGRRVAPKDVDVFNPAFDVTPHRLITGIVTERGVLYPPFRRAIARIKAAP